MAQLCALGRHFHPAEHHMDDVEFLVRQEMGKPSSGQPVFDKDSAREGSVEDSHVVFEAVHAFCNWVKKPWRHSQLRREVITQGTFLWAPE
jgi:hypothetical protein